MLLESLQSIPFQSAFDILFRYEGISGLEKLFPGKWLLVFLRRRTNNHLWAEIIGALRLVQHLEHPAFAIYLLRPVVKSIPDSVSAWSTSSRFSDAEWILPDRVDLLIRAMKAFLPKDEYVYDWLECVDLRRTQSLEEWTNTAQACIDAYIFTRRWWVKEAHDSVWENESGVHTMEKAIVLAGNVEMKELKHRLIRSEKVRLIEAKLSKRIDDAKKYPPLELGTNDEKCARVEGKFQLERHNFVLKEVKSILRSKISCQTFDAHFPNIARMVMWLARQYPKIKWNLKILFHTAASERLGLEPWHVERELCRQSTFPVKETDPIRALKNLK